MVTCTLKQGKNMEEEIEKGEEQPTPTPEEKEFKGVVEVNGEKFKEDENNLGQPLLDEDGNPVPLEIKRDNVDYLKAENERLEKELESKKTELGQAQYTLRKRNIENKGEKLSEDKVREIIREETNPVIEKLSLDEAKRMAYAISTDTEEGKRTLYHYKTSILKTGDLEKDMINANAIASRGNYSKKVEEMQRALQSQKMKNKPTGAGQKKMTQEIQQRPALSPSEEKIVRLSGLSWDGKKGKWVGKSGREYPEIPRGEGIDASADGTGRRTRPKSA